MGWLTRIFRRGDREEAVRQAACAHVNLSARWDDPEHLGDEEKASGYACIACGQQFTLEEAQALGGTSVA